jgi:hypothetical protein
MNIQISILSLTKNNNGFFKSEKQAAFLIDQLKKNQGYFGSFNSGYHSCPLFATWDEKGIVKTTKSTKKGMVTLFERKVKGVISDLDAKRIKSLERKLKKEEKYLAERISSFESGDYNSTGDTSTYDESLVRNHCYWNNVRRDLINNLRKKISELK